MSDAPARIARGIAVPLALLVLWQLWGTASHNVRMPVPTHVVTAAVDLVGSGELPLAILQSLSRVFMGFAETPARGRASPPSSSTRPPTS